MLFETPNGSIKVGNENIRTSQYPIYPTLRHVELTTEQFSQLVFENDLVYSTDHRSNPNIFFHRKSLQCPKVKNHDSWLIKMNLSNRGLKLSDANGRKASIETSPEILRFLGISKDQISSQNPLLNQKLSNIKTVQASNKEINLYSTNLIIREQASQRHRVFLDRVSIPDSFKYYWDQLLSGRSVAEGSPWPKDMSKWARQDTWPEYALGTANAALLIVMHRPAFKQSERSIGDLDRPPYMIPRLPVLGGIPHVHNVFYGKLYKSKTWQYLHQYIPEALAIKGLMNPWSQVMTMNINTEHGNTGQSNKIVNEKGLDLLKRVLNLCRPLVVLLCGNPVKEAVNGWGSTSSSKPIFCAHPCVWNQSGLKSGKNIVREVRQILESCGNVY